MFQLARRVNTYLSVKLSKIAWESFRLQYENIIDWLKLTIEADLRD